MKLNKLIHPKLNLLAFLLTCISTTAHSATTLTGLLQYSTDSSGAFFNGNVWNTKGGDSASDLWVVQGSNPGGTLLNGPADSAAGISILLTPGAYTFSLLASGGLGTANHGLNLFFNGANSSPGISVFGPTQMSANPPYPAFNADGSSSTLTLSFGFVPGANSLVFEDSEERVTLTNYRWADPSVYGVDRVAAPFGNPGFVGSDGNPDWVGQISLDVVAVPEPGTFAFIGLGLVGLLATRASKARKL